MGVESIEPQGLRRLPETPAECRDLQEWMELVLAMTRRQVADCAGLQQSRVSSVFRGHLPRRKHWPPLLKALRLEKHEHEFYRMIMVARAARKAKEAAQQQWNDGEVPTPLLAGQITIQGTPERPEIVEHREQMA